MSWSKKFQNSSGVKMTLKARKAPMETTLASFDLLSVSLSGRDQL